METRQALQQFINAHDLDIKAQTPDDILAEVLLGMIEVLGRMHSACDDWEPDECQECPPIPPEIP